MVMVLNLHSFSGYRHGEGFLQALDFLRESTSICAVDTFILISGYFGIKWRKKGLFNLLFQVLFYSFAVYGVCVATGILQFDKSEFVHCFKAFYDSWSFITFYIVLYFVSPWLNAFSKVCEKKQLLFFIIIFWIAENVIMRASGGLNYCLLYLIGRYVAKCEIDNSSVIVSKTFSGYIVSTLVIFIISYSSYKIMHLDAISMHDFIFGYSYASPFVIMQALFLFLVFAHWKIQSKLINWLAASCLSIFLIHMHPSIKQIGYYNFTEALYYKPVLEHIVLLFLLFVVIFFGAILIDKIRIAISETTYNILSRVWRMVGGKQFEQKIDY